ncbi:nucleolar and coiled-body phosphoprotein 1-like isoform X2 [Papaver somniferum]|uniref:nucleolar and coiled-body phosphoprotein 1-like isoform X2 n=1 Tax=Papaver somniferum TaxID=3469 RepID=UPI000E6F65F2|nr:nucleolar and coiled-body phosphoprotein 1-like isoform X2 [Papaver somniferum]
MLINLSVSLFPFEPRQVTLANMKKTKTSSSLEKDIPDKTLVSKSTKDNKKNKKNKKKSKDLTPLLLSLADFLERQGYSKTLAAFKSEALPDEELDVVKGHALDVETMYFKYLEMSDGDANNTSSGKQDLSTEVVADVCVDKLSNGAVPDLPVKSKEKKKKTKSTSEPISESVEQSGSAENGHLEKSVTEEQADVKSKEKKKKTKSTSEPISESVEQSGSAENGHLQKSVTEEETDLKSKDKKKKRKKSKTESSSVDAEESEKGDSKNKDSKKRKRGGSEENESQADEKVESKDTKESKTKSSEEENEKDLNATPFTTEKAAKKQRIGSAEPKTANAFRRVEIEKVEFVDDRLQDNSYWAKHGADVGYGAKAQEVLGQVRGKDFRHEKTKKKRGSYRGGIIDQDSHSIKFNYSDEE